MFILSILLGIGVYMVMHYLTDNTFLSLISGLVALFAAPYLYARMKG